MLMYMCTHVLSQLCMISIIHFNFMHTLLSCFQPVDDEVTEFFEDAEDFYSTYLALKSSGIFFAL